MKRLIALVLFLTTSSAIAADSPDTAKGFQAGQLYQFGDVRHVNLYNGNLNVSLPIGQSYRVGGSLSYGFTLAYSGDSWTATPRQHLDCDIIDGNPENCVAKTYYHYVPTVRNNAGLGWYFSSGGQLIANDENNPAPPRIGPTEQPMPRSIISSPRTTPFRRARPTSISKRSPAAVIPVRTLNFRMERSTVSTRPVVSR